LYINCGYALHPYVPSIENVFKSACIPVPEVGSLPAGVKHIVIIILVLSSMVV